MDYRILVIGLPLIIGFIGGIATSSSVNSWYTTLEKPSFNPPSWVFGPVWTVLYIMMGVSLYLVLKADGGKVAITLFMVQLGFNLLWSILFFGLQQPFFAFIEIIILWMFILLTIISFYPISPLASYLMIPYILWVSFAAVLNFMIYWLN